MIHRINQQAEALRISRNDPTTVTAHMRTAEDWHNGSRSAMYRFGRHGCSPVPTDGKSPLALALKFYEKLARETARAIDENRQGNCEGERLTALHDYAHERMAEYKLLQDPARIDQ